MNMKKLATAIALGSTVFAGSVMAATDAGPAATATGTQLVELDLQDLVAITGLADLILTPSYTAGNSPITATDNFCLYRRLATGDVTVTATSANTAGGLFRMANTTTPGTFINYTVNISGNAVTHGTPLTRVAANVHHTDPSCAAHASDNTGITVSVLRADADAAAVGLYQDTLSLLVQPI